MLGLRVIRALLLVGSAALVAGALARARHDPRWLVVPAAAALGVAVSLAVRAIGRRRVRRMLIEGRAEELLQHWQGSLTSLPHADTAVPLLHATALAATGQTDRARTALEHAARGQAWPAAHEHRLVVETLLDSFEGEPRAALDKAEELCNLPLPPVPDDLRARVALLREAIAAVARAFAHEPEERDANLLREAARKNTLIHWPLRYAAAVVCIDRGQRAEARQLLENAPDWPQESAFRAFHAELTAWAREPSGVE
ncbi:MAG: hypothetical protein HYZ29_09340 [Myxococcales bacterium]|nr:hypothetical protein [Myxococcales bacterium]